LRQIGRTQNSVPLSAIAGYAEGERPDRAPSVSAVDGKRLTQPSDEDAILDHHVIRDALSRIPEPQRSAFALKHYYGWPIEDQDPNVRTISRQFGVDPRTIRNWLKRVD